MKNDIVRNLIIWVLIFFVFITLYNYLATGRGIIEISYTDFYSEIENGNVSEVVVTGKNVEGSFKAPKSEGNREYLRFKVQLPYDDPELVKMLATKDIQVYSKEKSMLWTVILSSIPWLLMLVLFWFVFFRQINASQREAVRFGKSRVKVLKESKPQVTFNDVAGCDEAKVELEEIIEFLRNPQKFSQIGARIPKGVLLVGPPGTGKTLLAKAVAGEAGVPFLSISGSEFVELFVGVGAARVRDLFEQGKSNAPCIIFIDEIDAVGRLRGAGLGGGHDEREQTLNQLLVEMDGFDSSEGIIVMAATNRPDILDPALLRPGRFDRRVYVPIPDVKGREEILKIHSAKIPLAEDVDLKVIAQGTPGFTGADLSNLVNEAALLAARKNQKVVTMRDFEEAKDKLILGIARRSMVISEEEKKRIAYHEVGHALVAKFLPGADQVHKITIIPHGRALGATQSLPEEDKYIYTKSYITVQLSILLGGRAAELLVFGEESTGAADDLSKATEIARRMVTDWGMSEKLGPVTLGKEEEEVFLGRELGIRKYYSEETARAIDSEVKKVVREALEKAKSILEKNINLLHVIAKELLEKETLTGVELNEIIRSFSNSQPEESAV
ncbi:MAG TPA: ATP-dependent zinc metalloprotease FtsH [Candidatus Hydrothermia bacterium]|nr:ATP-dependent zinc metalloprotease FtsH [Candidatus Hydrothermae bacterium]MDD3648513.1 ATP-dependent zinc metalloprotease FtsH [Candidatus Hydrothermia bacterium]HOK23722.1 ATP-dependent zinc metalloprotease FtsH [Candidatus Hydrothermia bacterium]HRD22653.1 ATP-dependent zinc metalloprotease FtsH [Candidatus Hydrothermia bacterium]